MNNVVENTLTESHYLENGINEEKPFTATIAALQITRGNMESLKYIAEFVDYKIQSEISLEILSQKLLNKKGRSICYPLHRIVEINLKTLI